MTPKHAALVAKVPATALSLAQDLARLGRRNKQDRNALAISEQLANVGYKLQFGGGVEKPYIILGDDHVLKIGQAAMIEADVSAVCYRARLIALTAPLADSVTVQERALFVVSRVEQVIPGLVWDGGSRSRFGEKLNRFQARCRMFGFHDEHSGNIGIYADGTLKLFDVYHDHGSRFLDRLARFGRKVSA